MIVKLPRKYKYDPTQPRDTTGRWTDVLDVDTMAADPTRSQWKDGLFYAGDLEGASAEDIYAGSSPEVQSLARECGLIATDRDSWDYIREVAKNEATVDSSDTAKDRFENDLRYKMYMPSYYSSVYGYWSKPPGSPIYEYDIHLIDSSANEILQIKDKFDDPGLDGIVQQAQDHIALIQKSTGAGDPNQPFLRMEHEIAVIRSEYAKVADTHKLNVYDGNGTLIQSNRLPKEMYDKARELAYGDIDAKRMMELHKDIQESAPFYPEWVNKGWSRFPQNVSTTQNNSSQNAGQPGATGQKGWRIALLPVLQAGTSMGNNPKADDAVATWNTGRDAVKSIDPHLAAEIAIRPDYAWGTLALNSHFSTQVKPALNEAAQIHSLYRSTNGVITDHIGSQHNLSLEYITRKYRDYASAYPDNIQSQLESTRNGLRDEIKGMWATNRKVTDKDRFQNWVGLSTPPQSKVDQINNVFSMSWDRATHGSFSGKINNIFRVHQHREVIDNFKNSESAYGNRTRLLMFHSTDYKAAVSIGSLGFKVFPSSDAKTGRMLGDGIYMTNVSSKAAQYISGSFGWGNSRGIMFINDVYFGRIMNYVDSLLPMGFSFNNGSYDTVWAKKGNTARGWSMRNDECCVVDPHAILPDYWLDVSRY